MPSKFCLTCHETAPSKSRVKGSFGVEIILWLFFIVPGLIYTIWRLSTRAEVCRSCGSEQLVPPNSPAALKAAQ